MKSIEEFLRINAIRQVDLARYLGINESSVSKMVHGKTRPSPANYRRLMDNDRGWITDPLRALNPDSVPDEKLELLLRENARLNAEVRSLRRERDQQWQVIRNLSVSLASLNPSTTAPKELNNK